ncbi:hypothetical protein EVAR_38158_1 [Eumeta japonica]|uniref:Uncharacterized protein n=1 Tax=Eumeta variegata TaxID=151549 RepID=A0A4C1ZJX2_EUMVA|nr:hypothetical protein EVAR_38158_1 [Eumeta japonica]
MHNAIAGSRSMCPLAADVARDLASILLAVVETVRNILGTRKDPDRPGKSGNGTTIDIDKRTAIEIRMDSENG